MRTWLWIGLRHCGWTLVAAMGLGWIGSAVDGLVASASGETRVYAVTEVTTPPTPRFQVKPVYPAALRAAQVEGQAMIRFVVTRKGSVRDAVVVDATEPEFGAAAVQALSKWRFRPGQVGGEAVDVAQQVPIVFNIVTPAERELLTPEAPWDEPAINLSDVEVKPVLQTSVKPNYPEALRREGVAGRAIVALVVDRQGVPRRVRAIQSTQEAFAIAAVDAVRRWRFSAGEQAGRPVNVAMQIPVVFKITDS